MSFIKGVGVLTVGTAISQGIMLLGVVALSRLYSPEEFGVYAVILATSTLLGFVSSFRYEVTILLPKQERLSEVALSLSFLISITLNLLAFAVVTGLVLSDSVGVRWLVVPFVSFSLSIINIGSFLQNRNSEYVRIVGIQIARSFIFVAIAVFFEGQDVLANGLIVGLVASVAVPSMYLLASDFRKGRAYHSVLKLKKLAFWARKHSKFVYYSTPAVLVGNLASQAPVFLLTALLGTASAGYYAMIQRVMMAPVALVSGAVNKVYLRTVASRKADQKPIYEYTRSIVRKFSLPGLALATSMFIAFHFKVLEQLFGDRWGDVDVLAMVMIPAFCISFVAKSISGFAVLGRNELGLIYQIILLSLVSLAILLTYYFSSSNLSVFLGISAALSLCYLGQSLAILRVSRKADEHVLG